eukprot:681929_1
MPPPPHKSIWKSTAPGAFKTLTRWLSKPHTKRGMLSNILRWRFRGQWKVGEDIMNNEYYLYQPFPETPIRRFCIYRHGQTEMDDLPFLWYQWIRYQRDHPPTKQELDEYDTYLVTIKEKAARIKERDDAERVANPQFYDEQKRKLEQVQSELTNKAQREVIALFQSRENALRIAAENKVAKMKAADDIIQSERRRYEELQFKHMQQSFADPDSVEPKDAQEPQTKGETPQPFQPGAWRPWQENDDENDDENDTETNPTGSSQRKDQNDK